MRLSIKWKLFYAANILLFVYVSICIIGSCYAAISFRETTMSSTDLLILVAMEFSFALMIFSYCLNLFMVHKYFPGNPMPVGVKRLNIVVFCFNVLFWLSIFAMFCYGFYDESRHGYRDSDGIFALIFISIFLITKAFVLSLQIQLPGVAAHHHRNKVDLLIESLGQNN